MKIYIILFFIILCAIFTASFYFIPDIEGIDMGEGKTILESPEELIIAYQVDNIEDVYLIGENSSWKLEKIEPYDLPEWVLNFQIKLSSNIYNQSPLNLIHEKTLNVICEEN